MSQLSEKERDEEREELIEEALNTLPEDMSPEQLEGVVFSIIASRVGEEQVPNYCVYLAMKFKLFLQDMIDEADNTSIH